MGGGRGGEQFNNFIEFYQGKNGKASTGGYNSGLGMKM